MNNKMLKVVGVLMIIFGGLGVLLSGFAFLGLSMFMDTIKASGEIVDETIVYGSLAIGIVYAILQLATGIIAVINYQEPEKAKLIIILGFILVAINIISTIMVLSYEETNILSILISFVLPTLLIIAGFNGKKALNSK